MNRFKGLNQRQRWALELTIYQRQCLETSERVDVVRQTLEPVKPKRKRGGKRVTN